MSIISLQEIMRVASAADDEPISSADDPILLLLEDIMNTGQRSRLEEFDNCLYLVLKMLR